MMVYSATFSRVFSAGLRAGFRNRRCPELNGFDGMIPPGFRHQREHTSRGLMKGLGVCSWIVRLRTLAPWPAKICLHSLSRLNAPVHGSGPSLQTGARIEKLRGNLRFPARDGPFLSGSMFLVVLFFGLLLWVLTQLRHIFRSLSRGLLFIPENARMIRWVGFTVIFGELARAALDYFWSSYTSLHFTADGLRFVAWTDFNAITIVAGLTVLVFAEVFREGTRLHEDQSLTI